jgi:tetratricopeptide (TPR) repeat protein
MRFRNKVVGLFHVVGTLFFGCGSAYGEDEERIAVLIEELSSETFKTREAASRTLWEMGEKALEALEEASLSDDPERAFRAADVLRKVELRITPGTSKQVIDLIEAYQRSSTQQKENILEQLRRLKAYHQMLTLYARDKPEVRALLGPVIRGVAILGAREAIVKNDIDGAVKILEATASDKDNLKALANVYVSMGQIDEQLAKLDPPENVLAEEWELALMRAKGDMNGVIKLASEKQHDRLLVAMKVLSGDPLLWLERNGMGEERQAAHDAYIDLAIKRWNGKAADKKDFAPLIKLLGSEDEDEKAMAISSLALLGRLGEVRDLQTKEDPMYAFLYHLSLEEIDKALGAIGMDINQPDYVGWVKTRFDELIVQEDDDGSSAMNDLLILASFLEKRGLNDDLDKAFSTELSKLAKEDEGKFLDMMGSMLGSLYGPTAYALEQATVWAGDDDARWGDIFTIALGDDEGYSEWRSWIVEIEPNTTQSRILEVILALTQRSQSHGNLREEWISKMWKALDLEKDVEKKKDLIVLMLNLAVTQQDVSNALKGWDLLEEEDQTSVMWSSIDKFLSAAGRWEDAVEILEKSGDYHTNSSPEAHAYLAVNLRRAGQEEKALFHDEMAIKLYLGDTVSSLSIGNSYLFGGDNKRALEWFRKAAIQADVVTGEFLGVLDPYADAMMREGEWIKAASCYEALNQLYASQAYQSGSLAAYSKERLNADLAKAMAVLKQDRGQALILLEGIHENFITDGVLADDFFPMLRGAGLTNELEKWFGETWQKMEMVMEEYPISHNTTNTAAWFASRAGLNLAEAEKKLKAALEIAPEQAAYLDTMAEIKFAQGDRAAALRWSDRAVCFSPFDEMIRLQNERFRSGALPKN